MKKHLVVKLHKKPAEDLRISDWLGFINDKTNLTERLNPELDRIMGEAGLKFWTTREYSPAGYGWSAEEMREGLDRTYRIILQQDYELPAGLVERIRLVPMVEDAWSMMTSEAELPRKRPAERASPGRRRAADMIGLSYAHAFTKGSPDIKIAVLDTGADIDHRELSGKFRGKADFVELQGLNTAEFIGDVTGYDDNPQDEVGHGTHVSGIIAARGLEMDEGVSPECGLMAVRVLAAMKNGDRLVGAGIVDNINTGIKWAVDNGADVINMSLGIKHEGGGLPHEDVIRYALGKNVTVVAASGNDGTPERYYPGALHGVIAVGAVDGAGNVAGFTSYGADIAVVAPGVNIYSSYADHSYASASGTSQASPFVAGTVGLIKSYALERGSKLTNTDITYILRHTSDRVDGRLRNVRAGYGLINLEDAFKLLIHSLN